MSVHLIGIGGSGLSAIARVLLERGITVSGSDRQASPATQQLEEAGVSVSIGHNAENIQGATLVIRSSAVLEDNVEVRAAIQSGIPVLKRSDFMERLMEGSRCIAIAGTHGKTTTTSMIAWVLTYAGMDPSYIIGSTPVNLGTNAHAGTGDFFVIEADEYDRMFLGLSPDIAVITNIEHDHPDCYPTTRDFFAAFENFARCTKAGGIMNICADDPGGMQLWQQRTADIQWFTYGLKSKSGEIDVDLQAVNLKSEYGSGYSFDVLLQNQPSFSVKLQIPGKHNVLNTLAAIAVGYQAGVPCEKIVGAMESFQGVSRRFDLHGKVAGVEIYDDYAHHPSEIRATIAAARDRFPKHSIWVVWQPHTYSRVMMLWDEFLLAFGDADHVVITDVFAAREKKPADFSMETFVSAAAHSEYYYIPHQKEVVDFLCKHLGNHDVVLVLSAGDANQISARLFETLKSQPEASEMAENSAAYGTH